MCMSFFCIDKSLGHLKNDLLQQNQKNERILVPKRLSDTRWAARHSACRALKAGYGSFCSALQEVYENDEEKKVIECAYGKFMFTISYI